MNWFAWLKNWVTPKPMGMSFTRRLTFVWKNAEEEALRLKDNFIGTEHLLLALLNLDGTVPSAVLKRFGLNAENVAAEIDKAREEKPRNQSSESVRHTPRTKMVLALATRRAKAMGRHFIATEDLLLGILEDGESNGGGVAVKILRKFKTDLKEIHDEIIKEMTAAIIPGKDREA